MVLPFVLCQSGTLIPSMSALIPFRPWKFVNGDNSQISNLKEPERKPDDRSPFVRYARSAALWAEWIREEIVIQEEEPSFPTLESEGYTFKLAVASLDAMRPLMSVPPSAKEHRQRLLEGVQLYPDPIVVVENQDGSFTVVANHELYEAAKTYQSDMARPGRLRSSDHCLIAIADESYLTTLIPQPLSYITQKDSLEVQASLLEMGYVLSPRADDPSKYNVVLGDQVFTKELSSGGEWKPALATAIGVKSLDISSKIHEGSVNDSGKKIVLTSPKVTKDVQEIRAEYPYGSIGVQIVPKSGAMMWSLRDF